MSRRVAVVGGGNASTRHAKILSQLGCTVEVLSRRDRSSRVQEYLSGKRSLDVFDGIVVATESSNHNHFLSKGKFEGFVGRILIEKPAILNSTIQGKFLNHDVRVAYNLRYLRALGELRNSLRSEERIIRAASRCLTYLPHWRDDSNSRRYYSVSTALGGGALNDLSHELDYLSEILGEWSVKGALGGRAGNVTEDADDSWFIFGLTAGGSNVSLNLSLLSRIPVRDLFIETTCETFHLDFLSGTLRSSSGLFKGNSISDTYDLMLSDFAFGEFNTLPTISENGRTTLQIESIRRFEGVS